MATLPGANRKVLKEGILQKRQRGKHVKGQNFSGLKFQTRHVCLDTESLRYYRKDKKIRGRFPVSSIAFVEKIPPSTFGGVKYGFQIGNNNHVEIMYFGAQSDEDRIQWMEAIRKGARLSKNVMISHYHPGAFGKSVQGQWSCCMKKERTAQGCHDTGTSFRERTRSEFIIDTIDTNEDAIYYDDDDECDDDSVLSEDSGCPTTGDMFGSRGSLLSTGTQGAPLFIPPKDFTDEQEGENREEIRQMLAKEDYGLLLTIDYGAALNAMDFRGTDTLIAGGSNGKVCVLDVMRRDVLSDDFSEVTSIETWRSLLLICTRSGVWLRDLDNKEVNHQLELQMNDSLESITAETAFADSIPLLESADGAKEYFAAFSPDGSRIVTANENTMEVRTFNPRKVADIEISFTQKLPGNILLLAVSPDPILPKVVVGVVKNSSLVLCICDYTKEGFNEKDIGAFYSSNIVKAHFLPSEPVLAVGHAKTMTLLKIAQGQLKLDSHTFTTEKEITSLRYSPSGDDLVLGMKDGHVAVMDGRASKSSVRHTLVFSSQHTSAVTSMSFSKDSSLLALGHSDGRLNLIKRPFAMKRKRENGGTQPSREFIAVPVGGGRLKLEDDDITVVFPDGFITQSSLTFEYSVTTHENPHSFPGGVRPVSVVLLLTPQQDVEFLKPIEITMPHFVDLETEGDCMRLMFCVAHHGSNSKELNFERVSHDQAISLSTSHPYDNRTHYATLQAKHCCYFCIGEFLTKEDTDKAGFVLTRAMSKLIINTSRELFLHQCFYYNLPTCRKLVEQQYPEELYTLKSFVVRFDSAGNTGVGIQVHNAEELKDNGWDYYVENGTEENKIYPKDINFWDIPSHSQLECMCRDGTYPPKFVLRVFSSGSSSCKDVHLKVAHPGVLYDVLRQMPILTVPMKGVECRPISRVTSSQSIDGRRGGNRFEKDALQSSFHYICKAVSETVDLAILLYSKNVITSDQLDTAIDSLGRKGQDPLKKIQNYKLLRIVQANVSKDPGKFYALCTAFEEQNLEQCSQKLQAALQHKNIASTSTPSGSEESFTSLPRDPDSITACEESDVPTPRPSQSMDPLMQDHSGSDQLLVFSASAGTEV